MHIRSISLLFLGCALPSYVFAQLGYQAEIEWISYPEIEEHQDDSYLYGLLGLDYGHIINRNMRLFAAGNVRKTNPGDTRNQERLSELYLDYRHMDFDLRSGFQKINWGRADIVNPLDFSPQDFRDPLDDDGEDLPVAGFSLNYYLDNSKLNWVILPYFMDSKLPEPSSIWFANLPTATVLGQKLVYQVASSDQPESGIKNWQSGIKWSQRGQGFDWAISYFYGWNDVPLFTQRNQVIDSNTIEVLLQPIFYRQHTIGFDSAWLADAYTVRSEIAYKHTRDDTGNSPYIDDPYVHIVMGVDRTLQNVILGKDLFVLFEYSYQYATTDIQYQSSDLDHIFENTLFARFGIDNLPKWEMQLDLAIDLASEGYFIRPQLTYDWFDNVKTQISLEYLDGNRNSFFGSYQSNKAIRLRFIKEGLF